MKKIINLLLIMIIAFTGYSQVDVDVQLQRAENVIQNNFSSVQSEYTPEQIYQIPVVFHILHKGEPLDVTPSILEQPYTTNISIQQIYSAIDNLTDRFRNTWVPYWEDADESTGEIEPISTDAGIEFKLASRDPNGNPTSGIIRHDYSNDPIYTQYGLVSTTGGDIGQYYNRSAILGSTGWPREQYLNIWVVSEINDNDGGCGSVSIGSFPLAELPITDGVILQWNKIGYGGFANLSGAFNASLTEAIGSYLGLYQTWRNTPTCEAANVENDCTSQGDMVCDTPPTPRNCSGMCSSRCASPNGEPSQNFYPTTLDEYPDTYNYMDDTGQQCKRRFTQGQVDRMRTTLETLRSDLGNYVWTQQASHNLGISIHMNRVGYNKYQPTIVLENSGDFDENDWSITVLVDENQSISHTLGSDVLGSISPRSTFNINFPVIQLVDFQEWNIIASLTSASDEYLTDNNSLYTFTKQQDGYLNVDASYSHSSGLGYYGNISIYDVDNDKVILNGRKYWNTRWSSNSRKAKALNKRVIWYGIDLYGRPIGNYVGLETINDIDMTIDFTTQDRYYLPPGNYIMRLSSSNTYINGPKVGQHALLTSYACENGCYLSISYNEEEDLYFVDETSPEYENDAVYGGVWFPENINWANPYEYPFTVPTNFISTETSCLPENINGICDNVESNTLPIFNSTIKYNGPRKVKVGIDIQSNGYIVIDSASVMLSSDSDFLNVIADTTIKIKSVSEDWVGVKVENEVWFTGLQPETEYWTKSIIKNQESSVVSFLTNPDACDNLESYNYNGVDYDIVPIGNQCWFAKNLRTDQLNDGTPIVSANTDANIWVTQGINEEPVYVHNSPNVDGRPVDNTELGNMYSGWAVQTGKLCPTGWRVSSHWDWQYIDSITGSNSRQKLLSLTSELGNSYRTGGIKGTDEYGLGLQVDGQYILGSTGENFGFAELGYWTKNPFSETIYGGPMPPEMTTKDAVLKIDLSVIKMATGWQNPNRELDLYSRTQNGYQASTYDDYVVFNTDYKYAASGTFGTFKNGNMVRCIKGQEAPEVIIGNKLLYPDLSYNNGSGPPEKYCNFNISANVHNNEPLRFDDCGECGGPGILDGFCDCEGNIPDAIGICGGDCDEDLNDDGICDIAVRALVDGCASPEIDGHTYAVVAIGDQCWFAENLKTTTYNNGEIIGEIQDSQDWKNADVGAWCHYNNDVNNETGLGKLYNWYAVDDSRNVCPSGWHVPTDSDWKTLETEVLVPRSEINSKGYRGVSTNSGDLLGPTSTTGFSGDYAGIRIDNDGSFREINNAGYFWTNNSYFTTRSRYANSAWHRGIFDNVTGIGRYHDTWQTSGTKGHGMSVRCIKD